MTEFHALIYLHVCPCVYELSEYVCVCVCVHVPIRECVCVCESVQVCECVHECV